MGMTMDYERKVAGVVLRHGEDEGEHWIQAGAMTDGGTIDITATITAYPRLSDEFVLKVQRLFAAELVRHLLDELEEVER